MYYSKRDEILAYFQRVSRERGVTANVQFGTEVTGAVCPSTPRDVHDCAAFRGCRLLHPAITALLADQDARSAPRQCNV